MARCTFKKFTLTVHRYSSAIGFFMINSWQISPQNNVSQILMEKSLHIQARCPKNLTLHCQSSIPFPSHVAARHVPTVPSLLSCSSRIKSSSGMAEHLKTSPWTPATSTEVQREHQAYYKMEERLASLEERMENIIWLRVNGTVLLFTSTGIFFVVLDACSGAVMGRQHFDTVTSENPACAVTDYVQTSIKER
ncbi:uncharacterized protein [Taeniopygia guttata]